VWGRTRSTHSTSWSETGGCSGLILSRAFCPDSKSRFGAVEHIKRGEHRMSEKELLEEIFELALQNDMDYLG